MMVNALNNFKKYVPIYLRLALGFTFLSAVADRFGLWGPPGTANVAWGNFQNFLSYTATLNPYLPTDLIPLLGWFVTAGEIGLGLALIFGFRTRWAALLSGFLLFTFILGITLSNSIKGALDYSVFTASAGAFMLALWHTEGIKTNNTANQ
ncbi:MauE/DoxX family redox-associated membrane protein [Fodinibius salsisoli]|uniref:DoxX family membrane protein n=1 Tax=Fodinibius salsisoli TaxID=2820877 RepID=A0ABT3PQ99_9BACT|nr:MauE/DoxX family redox-associated membrane protein [Fodinibius salsisoli]MCW9708042.1 DoxX family membrane protein [Fodinibius salsisoli]